MNNKAYWTYAIIASIFVTLTLCFLAWVVGHEARASARSDAYIEVKWADYENGYLTLTALPCSPYGQMRYSDERIDIVGYDMDGYTFKVPTDLESFTIWCRS